ncbi:MAG: hypothetical protein GX629_12070, partial [Phycisphaerae bacterium]|nr:hypothetical protein [Phycisphaerae bacterium]
IGSLQFREIALSTIKTLIASGLMAVAVYFAAAYLPIGNKYILLTACLLIAMTVFFPACFLLRIEEAKDLFTLARKRRVKTA